MIWILVALVVGLLAMVVYDLLQRQHAILRNFPIIGHFRYWLEAVGPELRQYIVTSNDEERPFSRDQRRWVYASAKREDNYFGFGTDNDIEHEASYLIVKHHTLGYSPTPLRDEEAHSYPLPSAKILGAARGRPGAFRPTSIVNVSGMSFGSLSGPAVEAMNRGAALAGCLHNTGEGGIATHHLHGGELIWQIGTGYFGCRDEHGNFDLGRFKDAVAKHPVRAIEIKLSQGAKPGLGGVLPKAKISLEIAAIRGIPRGRDCISPPAHSTFDSVDGLLDFAELLAHETGLPVGIKSAVGTINFWVELADRMVREERGVDFITIDGGEGGTGAAPLVFTDHVAMPFKIGFSRVFAEFAKRQIDDRVFFFGSGKLGLPETAFLALALGCDAVNVGREAMLAVGCIQAQRCHTGHCPTGVATQNKWLMRGLDPTSKAARLANYVATLRENLLHLSHACGVPHPACVTAEHIEFVDAAFGSRSPLDVFGYQPSWGAPGGESMDWLARTYGC